MIIKKQNLGLQSSCSTRYDAIEHNVIIKLLLELILHSIQLVALHYPALQIIIWILGQ